jgi:hypothetical protein
MSKFETSQNIEFPKIRIILAVTVTDSPRTTFKEIDFKIPPPPFSKGETVGRKLVDVVAEQDGAARHYPLFTGSLKSFNALDNSNLRFVSDFDFRFSKLPRPHRFNLFGAHWSSLAGVVHFKRFSTDATASYKSWN